MRTKKITALAMLTAIALTIFLVESMIPLPIPLPGVKLGLSNIVTVFVVFFFGPPEAVCVLAVRIFLGAVFSGNFSTILYSAGGGALAILTTIVARHFLPRNQIWVAGCLGAIAHAIGQMLVAVAVTGTPGLLAYLPAMILCAIFTGALTGHCAQYLVKRGKKLWKTTLK